MNYNYLSYFSKHFFQRKKASNPSKCLILPVIFLSLLLFLTGCDNSSDSVKSDFDDFLDQCLIVYASQSKIYVHSLFEHPEDYGIDFDSLSSFGSYDEEKMAEELDAKKAQKEGLESFDPQALSQEQQAIYSILDYDLTLSIKIAENYEDYATTLGSDGTAISTIRSLCEYRLKEEEDVEAYLSILEDYPLYLDELYAYEVKRLEEGISSSDTLIDDTVSSIDSFLENDESDCILSTSFADRLAAISDLSDEKKETYLKENQALTKEILSACQDYVQKISSLHPKDDESKERIVQMDGGSEYYNLLIQQVCGRDYSSEECKEILQKMYADSLADFRSLKESQPDLFTEYYSSIPEEEEATDILEDLRKSALVDFPSISQTTYEIIDMPDALANYQSVAYYMIPPLDGDGSQTIEISEWMIDGSNLYATLAHEGYPGHMYQTVYMYEHMIHPIQACLRNAGYDEGWGYYAQMYGYDLMTWKDLDEDLTQALQSLYKDNAIMSICLCGLSDLYVNDENHTMEELVDWLEDYGISESNASTIYHYVIEHPTSYFAYGIGYYELMELKEKAEESEDFSLKSFHEDLLSYGSCPFSILEEILQK